MWMCVLCDLSWKGAQFGFRYFQTSELAAGGGGGESKMQLFDIPMLCLFLMVTISRKRQKSPASRTRHVCMIADAWCLDS